MARFFLDWATWQKLVLILAIAIVVTVLLGFAKLGYAHWKLRKDVALAEMEKREQPLQRNMSQRKRTSDGQDADVPFGIRAIESGIEVEGVWNSSRPNTPEAVNRENSNPSSIWDHVARQDHNIDLEKQADPVESHHRSASIPAAHPSNSTFDRAVSAERLSSPRVSRDSSPDVSITKPTPSRHPPSSLTRFNGQPYVVRQDSATSTLHALDALYQASGALQDNGEMESADGINTSSNQSSNSPTDNEPIAASAPALLNHNPKPRHKSSELSLMMHHHRLLQAAETGQLQPRTRKSSQSSGPPAGASELEETFGDSRNRSRSPLKLAVPTSVSTESSPTSPNMEFLPPALRRSSMPNVTPFTQFCQTAPSSPLGDGHRATSANGDTESRPRSRSPDDFVSAPSSPSKLQSPASESPVELPGDMPETGTMETKPRSSSEPKRGSFEHRATTVIRGFGTGFEILKPGTFKPPMPGDLSPEDRSSGPPISLHNSSRPRSSSADSRRKLQKKRRMSESSWAGLSKRGSGASPT